VLPQVAVHSKFVNQFTIKLSYFDHMASVGYDPMHTEAGVVHDIIRLMLKGDRYGVSFGLSVCV
jgi:hypothetical protein